MVAYLPTSLSGGGKLKNYPIKSAQLLVLCSSLTFGCVVQSAGFQVMEQSISGLGNAFAGASALGEDAATVFYNPAAMTQLKSRQAIAGVNFIKTNFTFKNQGSSSAAGNKGLLTGKTDNGGVLAEVPNVYEVLPYNEKIWLGIGFNAPFGLKTQYDDDWVGRYHAVKSDLKVVNINPSIAYLHNDKWSFGFGVNLQYLDITLSNAIDFDAIVVNLDSQSRDGFGEVSGTNWAFGYNFGALYSPSKAQKVGFAYRSKVTHKVSGKADFTVPNNIQSLLPVGTFTDVNINAEANIPAITNLGYAHEIGPWTLLAEIQWVGWSDFKELRIKYKSNQPDSVTTEDWKNATRYALGANYQYSNKLKLRAGFAIDNSPVPSEQRRTARVPDSDRIWLSIGSNYQIDDRYSIDFAFAHVSADAAKVNNTLESSVSGANHTLLGEFSGDANIFASQAVWHF